MRLRAARRIGIFSRMLIAVAPAALGPLVALIVLSGTLNYRALSKASLEYAERTVEARAAEIAADLGEKTAAVRALAYQFSDYRALPPPLRREYFTGALKAVLRTQPGILAAWTTWEPGAIEDDPSAFDGSILSTPQGGYNATWIRSERGVVMVPVEDGVYTGSYYTLPRERLVPVLVPPYRYTYTGRPEDAVLETTVSAPILYGGEFKGVVGFDVDVNTYQRLVASVRVFESGYAALATDQGIRISHPLPELIGTRVGDDLPRAEKEEYLRLIGADQPFTFRKRARATGKDSLVFGVPVRAGTATPHWVLFLVVPLAEVTRAAVDAARLSALLGLAAAAVILGAVLLVARSLSRPLVSLTRTIEEMAAAGTPGTLDERGADETARLAASFNRLSERLRSTMENLHGANRKLETLNGELETKVRGRTADLERSLDELREAQERMVRTEKFAVLGHLSAEIAHELNTPLAAVRSSADFIGRADNVPWFSLIDFAASADGAERDSFRRLLAAALENAKDASRPPASRAEKKAFAARLAEEGLETDPSLADDADALGALPPTPPLLELLRAGKRDAVRTAAAVAQSAKAGSMVRFSADKAAATVSALVSYARTETHEAFEPVDVVKEIEELLVLYYGATKRGVKIVRDYRCREAVLGHRDKLNQVWVNLVNNAIQAMDGAGVLTIRTERAGSRLEVSFADSGHGIPDEIKHKIFQPLFTTKRHGEGTGLGLDICKKIVEKHDGDIRFESEPGRTVFIVSLPVAGARKGAAPDGTPPSD